MKERYIRVLLGNSLEILNDDIWNKDKILKINGLTLSRVIKTKGNSINNYYK